MTRDHRRAAEDPAMVARMRELLVREWDPAGVICDAAAGGPDYYGEQALTIVAMLAADARETEIQRYLRQVEHAALGESLHSFEARRAIAVRAWSLIR
ncbi:MAG TPA: hypothetical protein VHQ45_07120 [Gemmatimonadaceae bacterium]|nr:hypothetical protein [Gemmatimonadaceae bacterium]